MPFLKEDYGNPSSLYPAGRNAKTAMTESRGNVAKLLNCSENQLVFTGCATESNNAVFHDAVKRFPDKKTIITTLIEHPSVLNTAKYYESIGYNVVYLPVDNKGIVDLYALADSVSNDTLLVSIMYVNNEIGNINPIKEITDIVKSKNADALVHTDAVQAYAKLDIDVAEIGIDYLTASGHKIYAPKGIGLLYIKNPELFNCSMNGGGQENGLRAGTENVAGIVGFGAATQMLSDTMIENHNKVQMLRDRIESGISEQVEECYIHGDIENRLYNVSNIAFKNIDSTRLQLQLASKGICVSTGSACSSNKNNISYVISELNVCKEYSRSLRISVGINNTVDEVDYFVCELIKLINGRK